MNRFFSSARFLFAATLAIAALGAATVAEARPNIVVSIGLPIGPAWVEPAPVVVQPRQVFLPPAPVFARPAVFVAPRAVFERPYLGGDDARFGRDGDHDQWRGHDRRHDRFHDGDRDRDDNGRNRGHRD